jgi:UDP-N-acetylglucosamine--N-acetylmuramyl-(pentapeptide) pyrophosphoryl-undecaprenol N-acetylglucosamine transferase
MAGLGCNATLVVSEKEVDRHAVGDGKDLPVLTVPAVGLTRGRRLAFARGFAVSFLKCVSIFRRARPDIVLAMGGFTSAPPLLAGRLLGAAAFLHESNSIPGRANRLISRFARESFIGFPSAASGLVSHRTIPTGTPVRSEFFGLNAAKCRATLCLDPDRPVVLIMGGSQGAEGINRLVVSSLDTLKQSLPDCQWFHVAGSGNTHEIKEAYKMRGMTAEVRGFMPRMDLALGAATAAVSRSGASSLAEIAAAELPTILIPYPTATDNHQYFNAKAYCDAGASALLEQHGATPESFAALLARMLSDAAGRQEMRGRLRKWQSPDAAERIALAMLRDRGFAAFCPKPPRPGGAECEGDEFLPCAKLEVSSASTPRTEVAA